MNDFLLPDEFIAAAKSFVEIWNKIETDLPKWRWVPCKKFRRMTNKQEDEGYLCLENVYYFNEECCSGELSTSEDGEKVDGATLVHIVDDEVHTYDFHIVYSFSYRVPVLYFRGHQSDGQQLGLDAIGKDLPHHSLKILKESKWTYMTQEEHPYLHRPWYTLHPCGTSNWMKLLLDEASPENCRISLYLPSWLSVVGQAVGLKIPIELQVSKTSR